MTEQAAITSALVVEIKATNKRLDRIVNALDGNSRPGLIMTVATHTEQIKATNKDIDNIKTIPRRLLWVAIGAPAGVIAAIELFRMV